MSKLTDLIIADIVDIFSECENWEKFWGDVDSETKLRMLNRMRARVERRLE